MAVDELATQGARSSSAIVLTWFPRYIPVSAAHGLMVGAWGPVMIIADRKQCIMNCAAMYVIGTLTGFPESSIITRTVLAVCIEYETAIIYHPTAATMLQ